MILDLLLHMPDDTVIVGSEILIKYIFKRQATVLILHISYYKEVPYCIYVLMFSSLSNKLHQAFHVFLKLFLN